VKEVPNLCQKVSLLLSKSDAFPVMSPIQCLFHKQLCFTDVTTGRVIWGSICSRYTDFHV